MSKTERLSNEYVAISKVVVIVLVGTTDPRTVDGNLELVR